MALKFCPIASGSSGNSTYISSGATGLLIDAGVSARKIQQGLLSINEDPGDLSAILITHEHSDHIKGAAVLSKRYDIPIYATAGTWNEMDRLDSFRSVAQKNRRIVYIDENLLINDVSVRPFLIPHDAAEPAGYSVKIGGHKVSVLTDVGCVNNNIIENVYGSDILLIESNHDVDMLVNGSYPYFLKKRVLSDKGHLSNVICGQTIGKILDRRLKHVYLGHLSEENNRPELAFETVSNIIQAQGANLNDLSLHVANRYAVSRPVLIGV